EDVAQGLVEMLRIPGLGVQKVRQIHEHLQPTTPAGLEEAAYDGPLAAIPRFGVKTAENVLKGIAFLKRTSEFRLFHHARAEAVAVQRALGALPGVQRVEIAGSVRRRREVIRDLDFVAVQAGTGTPETLVGQLGEAPGVDVVVTAPEGCGRAW